MPFFRCSLLILVLVFVCYFGVGRAVDCELHPERPFKVAYTITVDGSGRGNFSKVQDAINFIPSGNTQWIRIQLNNGIYREQVKVPQDKTCILLEGRSARRTSIEFDGHLTTDTSPTFISEAENFVAKSITFKNTYNYEVRVDKKNMTQAVAAEIKGDKSSFYNCIFCGLQDTLWDASGRHYFHSCYIHGAVDFIWGNGQSIYERCQIIVLGDALGTVPGYITAQGRSSENDPSGFIFKEGKVFGTGLAWLGRAYRDHSRVIFDGTFFNDVIHPQGWWPWDYVGHEENFTYAEANCHGPGSDTSKRVRWEKKLSPREVHRLTDISFIDSPEGWLSKQPN